MKSSWLVSLKFGAKLSKKLFRKFHITLIYLCSDCEPEILRNLYARKMDNKMAYDAIIEKQKFQNDHYPVKIN